MILSLFELLAVFTHGLDELEALLLLFGTLEANNHIQELLVQPVECDRIVDDHGLTHDFWSVAGVSELGGEVEIEIRVEFDLVFAQLEETHTGLHNEIFLEDRVQSWVQLLVDVLEEHWFSELDSVF